MWRRIRSGAALLPLLALQTLGQIPLPDDFASAWLITNTTTSVVTVISTNLASAEPGEPNHAGQPARHSQWVRLQYPVDGQVNLGVQNMRGFRFAVYTGESLVGLSEVTSVEVEPGWANLGWEVQAGVVYSIAIDLPEVPPTGSIQAFQIAFQRIFIRPNSPLPEKAPAVVEFSAVSLDPEEPFREVTFLLNYTQPLLTRTNPPWTVTVTNEAGGFAVVSAQARTTQRMNVYLNPFQWSLLPPNDAWVEAVRIPGTAVDWSGPGSTQRATAEPGEPEVFPGLEATRSIWWAWTPDFSGWTRLAARGATFQLFAGSALGNLVPVPAELSWSSLPGDTFWTFIASAGTPYYLRFAHVPGQNGQFTSLSLNRPVFRLNPPPGLLLETNAAVGLTTHVLGGVPQTFSVTELNPGDSFSSLQLERWSEEGYVIMASATAVPRQFTFTPAAREITTLRVRGTNQFGEVRTSDPVTVYATLAHDRFESPVGLPSAGTTDWDWSGLTEAGRQPGEPAHGLESEAGSLWFHWTPPTSGTARILLPAAAGPIAVAVYTGSALEALERVAMHSVAEVGSSLELAVPVVGGVTYRMAVAGADPFSPASLEFLPIRVDPVAAELRAGDPVDLRAGRFGPVEIAEVVWTLNDELLATLTPNPSAGQVWTPSVPGPFTLRATGEQSGQSVLLLEVQGWIRPTNDRLVHALPLAEIPGLAPLVGAVGTVVGAALEVGEASAFADQQGTVWFSGIVPDLTPWRVRQVTGTAPVRIEVFEVGTDGALQSRIAIPDLSEPVTLPLVPGTIGRLAVSSADPNAADFAVFLGPAPVNDNFADAQELVVPATGGTVSINTVNVFASSEPGETEVPALVPFQRHGTLWWKFTAPGRGNAFFHLSDSTVPTMAAVFTGASLETLELVVGPEITNGNPVAWAPFPVLPGVTYWIAASGNVDWYPAFGSLAGAFVFESETFEEVENDPFANRLPLAGTDLTVTGSTLDATVEPNEPAGLNHSVWWEWTAPATGAVRIWVSPVPERPVFAVIFSGDTLETLQPATVTDEVYVHAGQRLQVAVSTDAPGPFELRVQWREVAPPSPNDHFADRIDLPAADYAVTGNLHGATTEPDEPLPSPDGSLWWRFIPPAAGVLEVTELESDSFMPVVEFYETDTLYSFLSPLPWNGSRAAWKVEAGQSYALRLTNGGGTPGEFRLATRFWRPVNDAFAEAEALTGSSLSLDTWLVDAGMEPQEPRPHPDQVQSLWWRWTAPATGRLEQTWPTAPLTPATIYRGTQWSDLMPLPGVPASPHLGTAAAVVVTAGESYFIQFTAAEGVVAPVRVSLFFVPFDSPENDPFAQARFVEGPGAVSLASGVGSSREPGEPAHGVGGANGSLWWRYVPPNDGLATVDNAFGTLSDVVLAVYQGPEVEALQRLVSGTNQVQFPVSRGDSYYVAAEVPAGAVGDVGLRFTVTRGGNSAQTIPENLVGNFSFEQAGDWNVLAEGLWIVGAPVGSPAADGANYLSLGYGSMQQELFTAPGRRYRIRLAFRSSTEPGEVDLRLRFDHQQVAPIQYPSGWAEHFWHWRDYEVTATTTITLLELESLGTYVDLDAISVIPLMEPPRIVQPPEDVLSVVGGAVTLVAGVTGSEPLSYLWFHNDQPVMGGNQRQLMLNPVSAAHAGSYRLRVTNAWGAVTSAPVVLMVESGTELFITRQPVGEAVIPGQYLALDVVAVAGAALEYQWYRDGVLLLNATNRQLVFDAIQSSDLGRYEVVVHGNGQTVTSLPAHVTAAPSATGGGLVDFSSWENSPIPFVVQVTDVDGITPLEGSSFVAQLYAGPTPETLRPVGAPRPFLTGTLAGRWISQSVVLPQIAPGQSFSAQVRAWDRTVGASYEEARALGGRFGRSGVTTATAGEPLVPPPAISTFASFSLRAGQPGFTAGRIDPVSVQPDGSVVWRLTGGAGFRYLLEQRIAGANWQPIEVFNDFPGSVTFTTPLLPEEAALFRARLLD